MQDTQGIILDEDSTPKPTSLHGSFHPVQVSTGIVDVTAAPTPCSQDCAIQSRYKRYRLGISSIDGQHIYHTSPPDPNLCMLYRSKRSGRYCQCATAISS